MISTSPVFIGEVVEVYAQGAVLVDPAIGELGDIDTALTTARFENGALGVIDNSRKAVYGYDQRIEVFGSGGCVSADNDYPSTAIVSGGWRYPRQTTVLLSGAVQRKRT